MPKKSGQPDLLPGANTKLFGGSHLCHCEERYDEAISTPSVVETQDFTSLQASLAMTQRAVPSNDFAIALAFCGSFWRFERGVL
jgi:hypothetical protein